MKEFIVETKGSDMASWEGENRDGKWDDKFDLLKSLTEVESNIRDIISSDFVLAKLGEKDKKGIIEMVNMAYYCRKVMMILQRARKPWWNNKIVTGKQNQMI